MKNQMILDKIDEKTCDYVVMNEFMKKVFDVEVQNKNYKSPYLAYIEAAVKMEEGKNK